MAVDTNVYSSKQFELYIALQSEMGVANTTNNDFVKLGVVTVSDIDFGGGLVQERTLRSGQQIKRITDHYVSQKGASATMSFEWVVNHRQGLDKLLGLISEDTASVWERQGSATAGVYSHGNDSGTPYLTGKLATVILHNPNTNDDRVLHSAALTELTIAMDTGSEGGRLVASGSFFSGYKPTVGASTVVPGGTETAYVKTIYDCTTKTLGGNDAVVKSFTMTWGFPCVRVGFQGASAEAEQYGRNGEYTLTGSMSVKYDQNTDQELAGFLAGSSKAIVMSDGSTLVVSIPQSIYTGYNLDLGDNDEGVFVEIPFEGTANGSEYLFQVTTA